MTTTEDIYDDCGFIPFKEYENDRTPEQKEFMDKQWFSEKEVTDIIKKLKNEDIYHKLGKPNVWRWSNDEVVDNVQEFIVNWLKTEFKIK